MKSIGTLLKNARENKNYSLIRLEEITKIKSSFIESIENEEWEKLPAFATILGFVKSISTTLGIDPSTAVAVLKRDYPPKKLKINPTPDIKSKFVWSPKLTFFIGIGTVLVLISSYLIFQYSRFVSPPNVSVDSPKNDQVVSGKSVLVFGTADIDSKITVNNQPVILDENGKFSISLEVSNETKEVVVNAVSRSGKETVVRRTIKVE